ncbi:UvrD-helicase domain-containing protein [Persephonella atlantica]|uniref:DNA 3'-5' helicase n=1 Tax=Persephonella atlantica TaxID=2699429 RepID=A0ABS1GGP2_9AQUI|nr:UvrD-helicase domain-containing protein [Persephonella atlantica]MBK3332102.1 UvrD-helicase domain-containing protein [Persephonella atlantica]
MPNINYIASAGTGKTHSLVYNLIQKVIDEDISLKDVLILTFTEKAAAEIKDRISKEIIKRLSKPGTDNRQKIKLHKQIVFLSSSFTGTFHSVFLRILKKFPHISGIDNSYRIIDNLQPFLIDMFDRFIQRDLEQNPEEWEEIVNLFEGKPFRLFKIFSSMYIQRLKLVKEQINNNDLDTIKKEIKTLKKEIEIWIDTLVDRYPEILEYPVFFHTPIHQLKKQIENPSSLKIGDRLIKKQLKNASQKEKEYFQKFVKPVLTDGSFLKIERKIVETGKKLSILAKDYNGKVILRKFYQFLEFVEKFKKEEKLIDFNDILEKTASLIENRSIREQLKSSFRYIFVDEFQDTDVVQAEILKKISSNNLYIFGDPKQCIYTWRDADLNVYFSFLKEMKFEDRFLQINHRSSKGLVDFFNRLLSSQNFLSHIDNKFKKSVASNYLSDREEIKLFQIKSENICIDKEADLTAYLITKITSEGYSFKDITILFYRNKDLQFFREHLLRKGIPVSGTSDNNLFKTREVQTVINIFKVIHNSDDRLSILNVLKSPLLMVEDKEIFDRKDSLFSFDYPLINLIKNIISKKHSLSLEQIIDLIYEKTDILQRFALMKNGKMAVKNLEKLRNIAYRLCREGFSLYHFISYVETGYEREAETVEENSVQLLTMHRSKGLQNKVVIIPLISKEPARIELRDIHVINNRPAINITTAVSREIHIYENRLKEEIRAENERLFYVAVTRAKEKLFFVSSGRKNNKNSFMNILSSVTIPTEEIEHPEEITVKQKIPTDKILRNIEEIEKLENKGKKVLLDRKPEKFVSVSKLMDKSNEHEGKGGETAVYVGILTHSVLENINLNDFCLEEAKAVAQHLSSNIPENIRETVLSQVIKLLNRYQNSHIDRELKNAKILFKEFPFVIKENGRFVEGRIDLIYQKKNTIYVMDFKTNRYETEEEKKKILKQYEKQKDYYLKAVSKLFPDKEIVFRLGLLWKGEVI